MNKKPVVFINALGISAERGSEPGKAYHWSRALSEFFSVCIFTSPKAIHAIRNLHPDWNFEEVVCKEPLRGTGMEFYVFYWNWCKRLIHKMQNSVAKYQPAAIFHPVLGSFRILPEYQKLSLPYVLGPLGGGEYTPLPFLSTCSFPKKEFVIEALRKPLNQLFVMNPRNRAVLKSASHVLATTTQTEDLLRLGGASRVSCVFPDVFESPTSPETFQKRRLQAQMGLKPLRLIFSGRALWWKGGSLALRLAQKLRSANIDFRLLMITQGPALNDWIKLSQQLGVNSFVNWSGFLPREELLKTFGESHCFIYPSLHDSSSSAIPEAFSCALPAITVGFGGVSIAASQGTGLNQTFSSLDSWLTSATELLRNWQLNPAGWLEASRLALERSEAFSLKKITNFLQTQVIPSLFTPSAN